MDTEFVNVYITKQKNLIDDLLAKNILLETKLTLVEGSTAKLSQKVEELEKELEKHKNAKVKAAQ